MTGKLRPFGNGSYVVHGVDEGQVRLMQQALTAEIARRAEPRRSRSTTSGAATTISERSHPCLFALFGRGRAQFTLRSPRLSDVDMSEVDAAHLAPRELTAKYPFLKFADG
jgi:hypothetical protein